MRGWCRVKVKDGVLEALADAGADFDAVPDLCEMSARKDSAAGGDRRLPAT